MKMLGLIVVVLFLLQLRAQAQTNRLERPVEKQVVPATGTVPLASKTQDTIGLVLLRSTHVQYSGVLPSAKRAKNPLQLINPFAPARYGTGMETVSVDPITGRAAGVALFRVEF